MKISTNIFRRTASLSKCCSAAVMLLMCLLCSCSTHTHVAKSDGKPTPRVAHGHQGDASESEAFNIDDIFSPRGRLLAEAREWLGTPYRYACADKGRCTDCSGFVMQVYLSALNMKLPRVSTDMGSYCRRIRHGEIKPGDLVFFATGKDPERISHVGIMIDSERFIHASSSKGVVVSRMDSPYYTRHFICYGRVPGMK